MQRRTLLRLAALSAGAAATPVSLRSALAQAPAPAAPDPSIRSVLLITKCHLDVGFTATQAQVIDRYFQVYFPEAIRTAAALRAAGPDHYRWTTGSWLLYEYLEAASPAERTAIEQAVLAGDLTWHALPFSWQTEMLDRSMITGALGFSAALDARFGRHTVGAKMTDVPGHTRGLVAPLAAAGVRLLDIGVNPASTPPDIPDVFLWRDSAGHDLAVLYHRHDYGSTVVIPGSDTAIAVEVRTDNSGPHTSAEIAALYAALRARFPNAEVRASDHNEAAAAVDRVRSTLPIVTAEIGDTWIYGAPSDPVKLARYREAARLRRSWIAAGRFASGDATDRLLLRRLALAPEHTWGTDTKRYVDYNHYRAADLALVLDEPGYQTMLHSWVEKRDDIDAGLARLPANLQAEASTRLTSLATVAPSPAGMHPVAASALTAVPLGPFRLSLDPATGAVTRLHHLPSRRDWASPDHPLALLTYQTLSSADYTRFLDLYIKSKADWAPRDFGKPDLDQFHPVSRDWHPRLLHAWSSRTAGEDRLLLQLAIDDPAALATGDVAWPREIFLDLRSPAHDSTPSSTPASVLDLRLILLGKPATRMPEALWLTFAPLSAPGTSPSTWILDKSGESVSPADVVRGGGRAMHAIDTGLQFRTPGATLHLASLDAPVVALGQRSPLNFSLDLPPADAPAHICLFNNAWGTNYPQWCGGDWTYRFTLTA